MHDYTGDRYGDSALEVEYLVCWECLALMKRFHRFKTQVQNAQEHLRVLAMSRTQEGVVHTFLSQSLSTLEASTKTDYDKIYLYYTQDEWPQSFIVDSEDVKSEEYDVAQTVRENIHLDIDEHILEVPEMVLENPVTGVVSHIVVGTDALVSPAETYKGDLTVASLDDTKIDMFTHKKTKNIVTNISEYVTDYVADKDIIMEMAVENTDEKLEMKFCVKPNAANKLNLNANKNVGYITDYMTEGDLAAYREELKEKVQYASSVYKCELCIIGFYTRQQVEDHFLSEHRAKPGRSACKVCYVYVDDDKHERHTDAHYMRYTCKLCGQRDYGAQLMAAHCQAHLGAATPASLIRIGAGSGKSKKKSVKAKAPPKTGDLRKLLSKTTIEGYQCLECDMFFKNSRARKNHVARFHREGFQCDHCKKRFVNRTTLATHLRLHEGPLPREECPICHKLVRVIQLKYHVQRHGNKDKFLCVDCDKTFSHLATYQAHLKYSRAHATDSVFKFPCPMCNKGYPSKEAMQDHFNYQHLGKTSHKCSICDKPIASRANVEKHMMRMHGQKKEKPKNHVCQTCGKGFTDKKALNQHEVIHSGDRPLTCDICQQTFKQKASLYTHRKRVHKVYPPKRLLQYVEPTPQ